MAKAPKFIDRELLSSIERYLGQSQMSETAFGRKVTNDSMLVRDIRDGREVRRVTRQRILAELAQAHAAEGKSAR